MEKRKSKLIDRIPQSGRLYFEMEMYKDEIYVIWNENSETAVTAFYDHFCTYDQDIEIHVFCHRNALNEKELKDWPSNFTFHFSSTTSDNALQTSLIVYVLEKFEKISNSLTVPEENHAKNNIIFIQKEINQFEELKSMLVRLPFITGLFKFKLLSLTNGMNGGRAFLFQSFKGHNQSRQKSSTPRHHEVGRALSENHLAIKQPAPVFGRRASNVNTASSLDTFLKPTKRNLQRDCQHCNRRKGSRPSFNNDTKNYFCLACYLHVDEDENEDLCQHCRRSKYTETDEKSTSVNFESGSGLMANASTNTKVYVTSVSCQTDVATDDELFRMKEDDLQAKFYNLMGKIDADQQDLLDEDQDNKLSDSEINKAKPGYRLDDIPKHKTTNKYHCPFCLTKSFSKQEIFEVHLKNVHKKCNCSCDRYFESLEDYIDHFYGVFPLHCFESRKCPERFRSIHYQAIHHSKVHYSQKAFHCVPCYDSGKVKKVAFRDVKSLQDHGSLMEHDKADMFLSIPINEEDENIPFTARSTAINFSG